MTDGRDPQPAPDPVLDDLLEEFSDRLQAGGPADPDAFIREHPERAEALRRLLPAVQVLAALDRPSAPAADGAPPGGPGPAALGGLGDFRLVREVGRGGMGVVYEAEQLSLGRRVALKVLPFAAALDARQLQRFRNEAQAAAQLHHSNIVPVYAVGCERGVHYYAMQFIDGRTLATLIDGLRGAAGRGRPEPATSGRETRSAVPPADSAPTPPAAGLVTERSASTPAYFRTVAELGVQAAGALEYAHQMGVVHRDVKPANLIVDPRGNLWVADFGLARVQGDTGLTATGDLVGTLRYMSPEQVGGGRGVIDHRTDVYSLGATLYELLSLEPAFPGRDRQEILRRIAAEEPRPPRRHNPAVPAELETVVLKAMAKEPGDRYATAQEVADDLRRFLEDRPIRARRPTAAQRIRKWARRHRAVVRSAAVCGVLLLVTAVVALGVSNRAIDRARGQAEAARGEADAARDALEAHVYYQTVALAVRERGAGHVRLAERLLDGCAGSRWRGWEWDYALRLRYGTPAPLRHASHLFAAAFSPDGRLLAAGDNDGTVTLWEPGTWRRLRAIAAHGSWARGVAFSPDGRRLASAGWDGRVAVWDPETGRLVWEAGGGGRADCVAFSPDGRTLAAGWLHDGTVRLWDAATGREVHAFRAHSRQVFSLAFSPDGATLATGSADRLVRVWDARTWSLRREFPGHAALVLGVAFSPDGRSLAAASGDFYLTEHRGELTVWDVATGGLRHRLCGPTESVFCVAFSPDGTRLASGGSEDPVVKVWDLATGGEAVALRGHADAVWAVAFSPDGRRLVSASADHTARVWDATPPGEKSGGEVHTLGPFPGGVACVAFRAGEASAGSAVLAAGCHDGAVKLWDARDGRLLHTLPPAEAAGAPAGAVACVSFSPDGELLAAGDTRGTVRVWETRGWVEVHRLRHDDVILAAAFSPDGGRLTVTAGKALCVWEPRTGRLLRTLRGHSDYVITLAFSPDGRWLASAGYDGEVKVWYARPEGDVRPLAALTGPGAVAADQPARTLPAHDGRTSCLAFSPDGRHLVSAGMDGVFHVWDAATWERVATRPGHRGHVHRVLFSPDGRQLATAGADAVVRVWEAGTGRPLFAHRGHTDTIHGLASSPDGRYLASAGLDGTVRVWDADPPPDSPARTTLDPER